jgi:hypothetical protein
MPPGRGSESSAACVDTNCHRKSITVKVTSVLVPWRGINDINDLRIGEIAQNGQNPAFLVQNWDRFWSVFEEATNAGGHTFGNISVAVHDNKAVQKRTSAELYRAPGQLSWAVQKTVWPARLLF